jgi:hypothetical protein
MSSSKIFIDPLVGNVGIGVANPTAKLHVLGNARIQGDLIVNGSQTTVNNYTTVSSNVSIMNTSGVGPALRVAQTGSGAGYPVADFYDNDVSTTVPAMRIADGGNVGIGAATPQEKLEVVGSIKVSDRIVNASGRAMLNQTGGVLQVKNVMIGTKGTTGVEDILTLSITPSSTSSKILVMTSFSGDKDSGGLEGHLYVNLRRNGSGLIEIANALGYNMNTSSRLCFSNTYVDSPATTSSVSYAITDIRGGNAGTIQYYWRNVSITLMEIAG